MGKFIHYAFCLCAVILLAACSDRGSRESEGEPYTLSGVLWQDSTAVDTLVSLAIDRHDECITGAGDTLPAIETLALPVVQGRFSYTGVAYNGADELFFDDGRGHVARLYGTPGAELSVEVLQSGEVSVVQRDTSELRRALVLRDSIPFLDSLAVRRALGNLPESAKPGWLLDAIDLQLDQKSCAMGKGFRLPRTSVTLPDTTFYFRDSRRSSLLILFWADYDSASVDSLRILSRIARDFGLYRYADVKTFERETSPTRSQKIHMIELMSVCLHAADSASWQSEVKDLPGMHVWLHGAFSHPLLTACQVDSLPFLLLADRFGNYQADNVWGAELYKSLERTPLNTVLNRTLLERKKK